MPCRGASSGLADLYPSGEELQRGCALRGIILYRSAVCEQVPSLLTAHVATDTTTMREPSSSTYLSTTTLLAKPGLCHELRLDAGAGDGWED